MSDKLTDREQRTAWFEWYCKQLDNIPEPSARYGVRVACPCCGYPTLESRGGFELCALCDWEDDGQDDVDADVVRGGPNGDYSLTEARRNFREHLTSYRPSDERAFCLSTSSALLGWKHKLIEAFQRVMHDPESVSWDEVEQVEKSRPWVR